MQMQGRLALVTGAGIRLGRALAEGAADRGMRLALHYHRHGREAEELAARVRASRAGLAHPSSPAAASPQALCFPADLSRPEEAEALAETVESAMSGIDVLLLSAAVYPREPLEGITATALEETLRVNLVSPFLLAREIGLRMRARGGGRIVALLDWSLDRPYVDRIPYTIAKAGLRAAVHGLARALAPEVLVNAVAPGAILLAEGTSEAYRERVRAATPLGRLGEAQDVVRAAFHLAESDFVTGTVLVVDGGRSVA
jgi:pteridine reductase